MKVEQEEPFFPHEELQDFLRHEIIRRYERKIPADAHSASLSTLLEYAGTIARQDNQNEPHSLLAQLPFSMYITANTDNLLEQALIQAGKQPYVMFFPWNEYIKNTKEMPEDVPDLDPHPDTPLIYRLFGHMEEAKTLVLTEDDYLDFLIKFANFREMIPGVVRRAFVDTALLILGFRLDDWDFKALFRSIIHQEGQGKRRDYTSIAVQLDPEDGQVIEPYKARHYFRSYFQELDFSIFWGNVEDFVMQLSEQWNKNQKEG
jgi:hypothetical protein